MEIEALQAELKRLSDAYQVVLAQLSNYQRERTQMFANLGKLRPNNEGNIPEPRERQRKKSLQEET